MILNANKMYPSDHMRSHLKWTTLTDRHRILCFKTIKKCVNGEAPIHLREMFKTYYQLNWRSTNREVMIFTCLLSLQFVVLT